MAEFTRLLPAEQAPSYIGLSQGTDKARANESLGSLFKGVGNIVDVTTKALDDRNINNLQGELYKGIDAIRGGQMVDAATADQAALIPPDAQKATTPPAIDSAVSEISRYQAAYADGSIGDSAYWAKVEALTRQVRARYPGYRDEIDKKVSSITGTTPANALRSSLLSDLSAAASKKSSAEDKFDTFVKQNLDTIPEDLRQKVLRGDKSAVTQAQVIDAVGQVKTNQRLVQSERDGLALKAAQKTSDAGEAVAVLTRHTNQAVETDFAKIGDTATPDGSKLMSKIQGLVQGGKALSPEDQAQLSSAVALLRSKKDAEIEAMFNSPLQPGSPHTFASVIKDRSQLDQIKKNALSRIDNMEQLLVNKEFGLFASNANMAKVSQDYTVRKLLESNDMAKKMGAARQILGDAGMGIYLSQNLPGLSGLAKALNDLSLSETVTNKNTEVGVQIDRLTKALDGKTDKVAIKDYFTTTQKLLADPKAAIEGLQTATSVIYRAEENYLSKFQVADQHKIYSMLTTPEITKNMKKLGESDPQSWNTYKDWAASKFYAVNKQNIADLKEASKEGGELSIKVDEEGRLSVVNLNPQGLPNLRNDGRKDVFLGERMLSQPRVARLQGQVDQFNRGMDSLRQIVKTDGSTVVDELGSLFFSEMGLVPPKDGKVNSENPGESRFKSLANTIQLTKYSPDEVKNARPDSELLSLEGKTGVVQEPALDLEGDKGGGPVSSGKYAPVLNLIGKAEGPKGYNQIVGHDRSAPLVDMTISEVYQLQKRMLASGSPSSAVGKFQFVRDTLRETVDKLGIDPDTTKFDAATQNRLAVALVGKSLKAYEKGSITKDQLADVLAGRWAGLPLASGLSAHHGVNGNKATVKREQVMEAIDQLTTD